MDTKEIAYHEAGHTVVGYLFYQPVELCAIMPTQTEFGTYLGRTICDIPNPIIFDTIDNELFFPVSLKFILYSWAGEYFQSKISDSIDSDSLRVDKEFLSLCLDNNSLNALEYFKSNIIEMFFNSEIIDSMVAEVADELLKKETLNQIDIDFILSKYNFDYDKQIELIMDELFLPIRSKYKEFQSQSFL